MIAPIANPVTTPITSLPRLFLLGSFSIVEVLIYLLFNLKNSKQALRYLNS
jgi:hypothetical protein